MRMKINQISYIKRILNCRKKLWQLEIKIKIINIKQYFGIK